VVVRVTSDCPVIDPDVCDLVIKTYLDRKDELDYVSNTLERTFPRGMDTEVFSFAALEQAHKEATKEPDREHVTPFIRMRPERFRLYSITAHQDESGHRWTVDTPEDLQLITMIFEALYYQNPEFSLQDILELMQVHPDWPAINTHVEQKKYGQ
jgi:spore coat polysaccharide biosynthesis protein SpsF